MSLETKIEKLTAKNYTTWKMVVTSLLKSKGLWIYCVEDDEPEDETGEGIPTAQAVKKAEARMMKQEEAKHIMYMSMDANQILSTGSCKTAYHLWNKIKENHEGAEKDLANNSLAEFLGLKYRKDETIIQYCGRFEVALGKLTSTGFEVNESTKVWVFRNSLPRELKALTNTWTMANPLGKVSELITQLKIQFHTDRLDGSRETIALYSGEASNRSTPNNQPSKQSAGKSLIVCNYCKLTGHKWRECRKLKRDNERKKHFSNFSQNQNERQEPRRPSHAPGQSNAFMADSSINPQSIYNDENVWIVDSGATSHMSSMKSSLSNYEELDAPRRIGLADGKATMALGRGDFNFIAGKFSGTLHGVLWVPELNGNLFSVCSAMRQGNEVSFTNDPTEVHFYKNNQLALKGKHSTNGLFTLRLIPLKVESQPSTQALIGATLSEWHGRFAHSSAQAIKELVSANAVTGLTVDKQTHERCVDCLMGKQCRSSHPNRNKITASDTAAVLHIDTCGPISTPSLAGSKYFVLATEEHSDYKLIRMLENKSETANAVKAIVNQVELESKRPVKRIQTDNGTEYINHNLSGWLRNKGINHDCSAPYTPEQNGRAERANRTIIEGIRTILNSTNLGEELWAEAANTVVYTTNRLLSPRDRSKTRFELYFRAKPDVSNLRTFGQKAMTRIPDPHRPSKLSSKSEPCIFIGYTERSNTYRFLDEHTRSVFTSSDAAFLNENANIHQRTQSTNGDSETVIVFVDQSNGDRSTKSNMMADNTQLQISDQEVAEPGDQQVEPGSPDDNLTPSFDTSHDNGNQSHADDGNEGSSSVTDSDSHTTSTDESNHTVLNSAGGNSTMNSTDSSIVSPGRPLTRSIRNSLNELIRPLNTPGWFWNTSDNADRTSTDQSNLESALFTLDNEPMNVEEARASDDWPKWKQAMDEELEALNRNQTWILTDRPNGIRPIKNKWVFKVKLDPQGEVDRYKARLVAKGFSQIPNIDFKETFAPVASMTTVRLLFALANRHDMDILQFDIKTAFLYGDLDETLFMDYPAGYPNPNNKVCKLIKSLYGLKQAPRQWNVKFDGFLKKFNLQQSAVDKCLYFNHDMTLLLAIYVDDGLVASKSAQLLKNLVDYLKGAFDLKTMKCESYLGFQVMRDRKNGTLRLQQAHYIDKILDKFKMSDCKPASTPEEVGTIASPADTLLTEDYPFKELVGSLLYLVTCTRPDISHAVSLASRTSKPTTEHWKRLKRILRYLKGTKAHGIQFRRESLPSLVGYADADYANDTETRRSNTGFCVFYGGGPVLWRCQRQSIVTLSTTEAEYVSGCELVKELLPIRELLLELKEITDEPTTIHIDNSSAVKIANNDGGQQKTKHIDIREKWLSEQVTRKKITVKHISGDQQIADILTKPLHKTKFTNNRNMLVSALAILTLISVVDCFKFTRVSPLQFRPTRKQFFTGDTEFKIRLSILNPCRVFFYDATGRERIDGLVNELINDCNESFINNLITPLTNCKAQNVSTIVSSSNELKRPTSNQIDKARIKRGLPGLLVIAVIALAGMTGVAISQAQANKENVERMAEYLKAERDILESGGRLFLELKNSVEEIHSWSAELATKINKLNRAPGIKAKYAGLIATYDAIFKEQSHIIKDLNKALEIGKISPTLRTISNESFWEEPAAEWSTVYNCSYGVGNDTELDVHLHFNMPKRDGRIKIVEAVPISFFNSTEGNDGKPTVCWMKYKGPKNIMVNTTNNCIAEIVDWATEAGSVRAQTCVGEEDQLKTDEGLWEKEFCTPNPQPSKRRIQDREVNGLHRIYCFPYNITIENDTIPCPDHVFELEGRTTYRIANLEHIGAYVEKDVVKTMDLHINREIMSHLKDTEIHITPLNSTKLQTAYGSYFAKLQMLPKEIELKKMDIIEGPMKMVKGAIDSAWSWIEYVGIICSAIAGVMLLVVIAPFIEVLLLGFGFIKSIVKFWSGAVRGLTGRVRQRTDQLPTFKLPKRKKHYWDDTEKMV